MFAPIFTCPKCGDTWHVRTVEIIDADRDEVFEDHQCDQCGSSVRPKVVDGLPVWHPLTEEEIDEMQMFSDEEEELMREGYLL